MIRKQTILYLNFSAHLIISEVKYQCYKLSFGLFCFFSCGVTQNKAVKCDLWIHGLWVLVFHLTIKNKLIMLRTGYWFETQSGNCIQVQTSFLFCFFITVLLKSKNCWQLRIVLIMAFVIGVTTSYLNFSDSGALICFFFWCSLPDSVYNIICRFAAVAVAAPDPASWELTIVWPGKMFSVEKIQV